MSHSVLRPHGYNSAYRISRRFRGLRYGILKYYPSNGGVNFSIAITVSCDVSRLWNWRKCQETLCPTNPLRMLDKCSSIRILSARVILPIYWKPHGQLRRFTTPTVPQVIKSFMEWQKMKKWNPWQFGMTYKPHIFYRAKKPFKLPNICTLRGVSMTLGANRSFEVLIPSI